MKKTMTSATMTPMAMPSGALDRLGGLLLVFQWKSRNCSWLEGKVAAQLKTVRAESAPRRFRLVQRGSAARVPLPAPIA